MSQPHDLAGFNAGGAVGQQLLEDAVMDTLVSTEWLSRHLDDPDLVVLDCTVVTMTGDDDLPVNASGRTGYEQGHIPRAGFADLKGELADPESPIEFAVPSPERFCAAMGALGVGDDSRVVLYDRQYTAWAARVWWMLRWVGFDRAAILDGGLAAWRAEDRPLETGPVERAPKRLSPALRASLIADRDEVLASIGDPAVRLIDTLPPASYRGEMALYGRPGHIPGASNVFGMDLLDETGHMRADAELAAACGIDRDTRTIIYCGGGILASLNAFAMTRLGFCDVAVYTASLQEWAANPDNPMTIEPS